MDALYDQIILFGDSITEYAENQYAGFNFAPALRNAYVRRLDVVNRGQSGYNTEMALRIMHRVIPRPQDARVRFLVIFFGANDACYPQIRDNQCVPLPEFKKNLIKLVQHSSVVAQNPKLVLIAPAPVQESKQRYIDDIRENGPKRTAENTKRYADAVREMGTELGIPVLDLWTIFAEKAGWKAGMRLPGSLGDDNAVLEKLLADGLHFAPAGYRLMYDEFMSLIQRTWPDQMPQRLQLPLPIWNDEEAWKRWDG